MALAAASLLACQRSEESTATQVEADRVNFEREVAGLSNTDIAWQGTTVGFNAELVSEPAKRLAAAPAEAAIPALLAALSDPARFQAAHVLLTRLSGVEYQTFPLWNGLRVDIRADGSSSVDGAQAQELARRWRAWHAASPRPKKL